MLLAHASQHKQRSVYPLPRTLAGTDRADKAATALIKGSLLEERPTNRARLAVRTEDDQRFGVFITAAGLAAIGIAEAYPAARWSGRRSSASWPMSPPAASTSSSSTRSTG